MLAEIAFTLVVLYKSYSVAPLNITCSLQYRTVEKAIDL